MRLTIRSFSPNDVGTYHCVSTNSLGRAEGTLRLYGNFEKKKTNKFSFENFKLMYSIKYFIEIKIHPGTSESDGDQLNIIGGEYIQQNAI